MRLIDADLLESHKFLAVSNPEIAKSLSKETQAYEKGWNDSIDAISRLAPIEEERPKGKWLRFNAIDDEQTEYECSNCGNLDTSLNSINVPFCWYCGAKMEDKAKSEGKDNEG